ncbi:hypothetical protein PR048_032135 [Dryococelus australis]|uniref:Uncharacterized protein n=1 Tax=Dryococelus australis TaxID=614101 RepID=A0ABQ9G4C6_9NEOP|nr:hypothetical protein PR048_032135 [Dryococelus australis]
MSIEQRRNERAGERVDPRRKTANQRHRPARFPHANIRTRTVTSRIFMKLVQPKARTNGTDGNTARLARRSDEALGVRVSVARIAPSLLELARAAGRYSSHRPGLTSERVSTPAMPADLSGDERCLFDASHPRTRQGGRKSTLACGKYLSVDLAASICQLTLRQSYGGSIHSTHASTCVLISRWVCEELTDLRLVGQRGGPDGGGEPQQHQRSQHADDVLEARACMWTLGAATPRYKAPAARARRLRSTGERRCPCLTTPLPPPPSAPTSLVVEAARFGQFLTLRSTNANRVLLPAGSLPDVRKWESCWTMPLVGGFCRGSPVSPTLAFRDYSILISFHPHRLSRPRCYEPPKSLDSIHIPFKLLIVTCRWSTLLTLARPMKVDGREGHSSDNNGAEPRVKDCRSLEAMGELIRASMSPLLFLASASEGSTERARHARRVHAALREHCTLVQSIERSGDGACSVRQCSTYSSALFNLKHHTQLQVSSCLNYTPDLPGRALTSTAGRGDVVVRLLTSYLGEPGSIPGGVASGFPHVGIMTMVSGFPRGSPVSPRHNIPAPLHIYLTSPSSALRTSMLKTAKISSLTQLKINDILLGQNQLDCQLVDDRPVMNAIKYRVGSGVVWTNRTMLSSSTNTNRTVLHPPAVDCRTAPLQHRIRPPVYPGAMQAVLFPRLHSNDSFLKHSLAFLPKYPLSTEPCLYPYDRVKRCRERKINIKASELVNFLCQQQPGKGDVCVGADYCTCTAPTMSSPVLQHVRQAAKFHVSLKLVKGPRWCSGQTTHLPLRRTLIFACRTRAGRCRWSADFSRGYLPFPPPLHSGAAPYSRRFTLIGS